MSEDNGYPSHFFHTNSIILTISALRFPDKSASLFRKCFYCAFAISLYVTSIVFFVLEIIELRATVKDATKFFSHIGLLITHLVGILKACLLIFGRGKIQKVMEVLQEEQFKYQPLKNFQPGLMLSKAKKKSSSVTILLFCLYSLAGVSAFTSAWSSIIMKVEGPYFENNITCYDFLPFYFHIPFPSETKTQCENVFTFMAISLCGFAWFIASHDGIFCALLNCLNTQLDILGEALQNIRCRTLKKLSLPLNLNVLHDEDYPVLEDALYKELNKCIKHLTVLLQARDDLEGIFTYITLAQTLGSILIISSCLFVATTVPVTSPLFFSQAEYFICILFQLWSICNFGNEITFSSGQIILSLYESDWFSSSLRYKKSMIMIMCCMQRPLYLSIGKFTPLTLITFMAVCRGSFSYFAVFRSIQ